MMKTGRFVRSRRGGIMTEAAVTIGLFLTIVLGLIDLGATFAVASSLEHAAGVARDHLATTRDVQGMTSKARGAMMPFATDCLQPPQIRLYNSLANINIADPSGGYAPGSTIPPEAVAARVELRCAWGYLTPVVRGLGGPTMLSAWTLVVLE